MARDLQESVVLSGKRTRTATVTFVAESVGLIKQEHRRIVLPRSRFNDTWLQQHLSTTLTPAAPAVPDEQSNNADIARVTGEMRARLPCRLAVQRRQIPRASQNGIRLHRCEQDSQEVSPLSCLSTLIHDD